MRGPTCTFWANLTPFSRRYRTGLEAKMTDVLTSLREGMLAMPGRMMQVRRVSGCL